MHNIEKVIWVFLRYFQSGLDYRLLGGTILVDRMEDTIRGAF